MMNVRLGIYEIFSRIVPGGVYLAAIVQFLAVVGPLRIAWQMINDVWDVERRKYARYPAG